VFKAIIGTYPYPGTILAPGAWLWQGSARKIIHSNGIGFQVRAFLLMTPMRTIVCTFLLLLGMLSLGCTQQLIPNTDVADTPDNRKVIEFCEEYRRAVETRKVGFLLSLAHPKYYEDGGNIDAADDIDREGLKEFLRDRFSEARGIRYEIRYRRVQESPRKTVYIDYTYSASYKVLGADGAEIWRRQVADNRLEL